MSNTKEMSTFTLGGKTFEIKDASARSNIQTITSDMSNYYTKSETYNKNEVDNLISSRREKQTIYITADAFTITSISSLSPNLSLSDLINTPVIINNEKVTYVKQASIESSSVINIVFENFSNTSYFKYSISTGQISVAGGGSED